MKTWILALIALLALARRGAPITVEPQESGASTGAEPPPRLVSDLDFDKYQAAVISLNRRMDAVEATLGGLAAIQIAALTYIIEKIDKLGGNVFLWTVGCSGALLLAILLAILAVFFFEGDEAPDLIGFDRDRRVDRKRTLDAALKTMVETYRFNGDQLRYKLALRTASTWLLALVVALYLAHVLSSPTC